jgi:hypothetical protein
MMFTRWVGKLGKGSLWSRRKKVRRNFLSTAFDCRKGTAFWKVPRLGPFLLLVTAVPK